MAGINHFINEVTEELKREFDTSKIEDGKFRFTGIDMKKINGEIEISFSGPRSSS